MRGSRTSLKMRSASMPRRERLRRTGAHFLLRPSSAAARNSQAVGCWAPPVLPQIQGRQDDVDLEARMSSTTNPVAVLARARASRYRAALPASRSGGWTRRPRLAWMKLPDTENYMGGRPRRSAVSEAGAANHPISLHGFGSRLASADGLDRGPTRRHPPACRERIDAGLMSEHTPGAFGGTYLPNAPPLLRLSRGSRLAFVFRHGRHGADACGSRASWLKQPRPLCSYRHYRRVRSGSSLAAVACDSGTRCGSCATSTTSTAAHAITWDLVPASLALSRALPPAVYRRDSSRRATTSIALHCTTLRTTTRLRRA